MDFPSIKNAILEVLFMVKKRKWERCAYLYILATRTLHIRKSNSIHFPFLSWSWGSSGRARTHKALRRVRAKRASWTRPTPRLEASFPRHVLLFPFNTQNRGVQDAAATIGRPADSSKQGRPIHPNSRYVQICKNLILSAADNKLLLRY